MLYCHQVDVGGRTLTIETGNWARQANGSVVLRYGDCVLLITATANAEPRESIDFLPLTVDFEERMYAAGKIPGSFFRREGRPSQEAILTCRLTDRPIRPLFPKGFRNDVQVIITPLSVDQENIPDVLAVIGASAALSISDIPFDGPVAGTRVGYIDNEFVVNPTFKQLHETQLDLIVAGTENAVVMIEAGANEVSETIILEAVRRGQAVNQEIIQLQHKLVQEAGKQKMEIALKTIDTEQVEERVSSLVKSRLEECIDRGDAKGESNATMKSLEKEAIKNLSEEYSIAQVTKTFDGLLKQVVRSKILSEGKRPDGRGVEEIRPVSTDVGLLPRTHGSALFNRGETQVLTLATLGSLGEVQKLDNLGPEEKKRFMHHYNFSPFSVGEVRRLGGAGRREIGHGALAERALLPVIPSEGEFPYAIRLVSEVLGSNGSTSMASTCASSLALMDAGVPIKKAVAGIAMGLIMGEANDYAILTDIQGTEDFMGDMDFKVAGTADGITALQMDIKVKGITNEIMSQALEQAHKARIFILDKMAQTITEARPALSRYAPRMHRMNIPVDKIGAIIGPGGRTIRAIIEETGVTIDIDNSGTVVIGSPNEDNTGKAIAAIEGLIKEIEVGEVYTGKVTRLMNFGAFVEILPGKEGLVHISELSDQRVPSVEEVVKVGDEVTVMVIELDRMGRVNLSRRAVLQGISKDQVKERASSGAGRPERRSGPPSEGGGFRR
jgi:polyribonucleotide nucleotidyltransferase